ncbi:N-formylglutamate amidohydrolase [Novispirillum sp. DQ9]|uniref:N-formylglutamate amidohydrolase n=1 Tax=Novispirillum sp. DQ9 TaxID=3398612 RepID=UPI003C7C74D8
MDALARSPSPAAAPLAPAEHTFTRPLEVIAPSRQTLPLVLASPHSGSYYPPDFVASSRLDAHGLRRSEDAYVNELCAGAAALGAPLLHALFPRAYLDPNREPYELDPAMFDGPLPHHCNVRSPRVAAGLGTIARMVASGADIYRAKLPVAEAEKRIDTCYRPYHRALRELVEATRERFGHCVLVDCHSMPSGSAAHGNAEPPGGGSDIVLGDLHGQSCAPVVTEIARRVLSDLGFRVARNAPYAGGYTTRHYGRPRDGVHALQIEINRRLYMNEATFARLPSFPQVTAALTAVAAALGALTPEDLAGR